MKVNILILLLVLFSITNLLSQEYRLEVIDLWENDDIPFNKENISLKETVDVSGKRYSQISHPRLYVYQNIKQTENGAALLYCPGGGYSKVVMGKNNGASTAKHYLKMGFNVVCMLKYRLPDTLVVNQQEKVPLCDAQKALSLVHKNASKWQVDGGKIAVMGSSAGGHLAASLANLKTPKIAPGVNKEELNIAVSILMYPVISFNLPYRHKGSYKRLLANKSNNHSLLDYYSLENQITSNTPPTFIIHAKDDTSVVYQNSTIYCDSLKAHGVEYKYVELERGGHGFGLNFQKTRIDWTVALKQWLYDETNLFTD